MTIRSQQSVGGIAFGATRSALASFGVPLREGRNRKGEDEVVFATTIYRFAAGKLVEVSFQLPTQVELNGRSIAGDALVAFLKEHDPEYRECYGFAIAPTLGLAVDLNHDDHWTSAFAAGRWDQMK